MTYMPTWAGFLYLAVVVDVYSVSARSRHIDGAQRNLRIR